MAAVKGHREICQLMIEKLKETHPKNHDGVSPLHIAVKCGHSDVVQLYHRLAGETYPNDEIYLLNLASKNGQMDVLEVILTNIAHKNPRNVNGETTLHYAADNGLTDIYQLIYGRVEDKNPRCQLGSTQFHAAAIRDISVFVNLYLKVWKTKTPWIMVNLLHFIWQHIMVI